MVISKCIQATKRFFFLFNTYRCSQSVVFGRQVQLCLPALVTEKQAFIVYHKIYPGISLQVKSWRNVRMEADHVQDNQLGFHYNTNYRIAVRPIQQQVKRKEDRFHTKTAKLIIYTPVIYPHRQHHWSDISSLGFTRMWNYMYSQYKLSSELPQLTFCTRLMRALVIYT